MNRFSDKEKNDFYRAADSLRKYRRAELVNDANGESILNELYCDPLPAQGLSTRINSANTTLIVGRKGTGKSTVFQKLQHDVRKVGDRLTAYIDIKTIWDSSQVDIGLQERMAGIDFALPAATVHRMLMYRTFLKNVVDEIKKELDKKLAQSRWERIKNAFSGKLDNLRAELDSFQENYSDDNFVRVLGIKKLGLKQHSEAKNSQSSSYTGSVTNLSRKYESELNAVNGELLLPRMELGILQTLEATAHPMRAGEIAEELDCSHQLVGWRAKHLEERQLVTRDTGDDGRRNYSLTDLAKKSYFDENISVELKVPE